MILIDKLEERTNVKIPIVNQVNSTVKEINLIDIENNDIGAQSQNVPFSAEEYVNSFSETSFSQDNQRRVKIISNVLLNSQTPNQGDTDSSDSELNLEDDMLNICSSYFKSLENDPKTDNVENKGTDFVYPSLKGYNFDRSHKDQAMPQNLPNSKNLLNDANGQNFVQTEFNKPINSQYPFSVPIDNNTNFNSVPNLVNFNSDPNSFQDFQNYVNPQFQVPYQSGQNNQFFRPPNFQGFNYQSQFPEQFPQHRYVQPSRFPNFHSSNLQSQYPNFAQHSSHYFNNSRIPAFDRINLKFGGKGQSLHSFLEKVEEFSLSHRISREHLLNFAHEFFEGDALIWYRSIRSQIFTWNDLIYRLRLDFLPVDFEVAFWDEVRARTQGSNERPLIYIGIMENLFKRFINPVDEGTQLRLIMRNLLPYYQQQLVLRQPILLLELKSLCRILEDTKLRSESFQGPPLCNTSTLEPELAYRRDISDNNHHVKFQHSNKPKFGTNEINISQPSVSSESQDDLVNFEAQDNCLKIDNQNSKVEVLNLASTKCWNCDQMGHAFPSCKLKRNVFCFSCGKKNITKPKCPNCKSKNGDQAISNSVEVATKQS
ncbi:unnamed protein product [Ceutorhynchus assimilis]|uniref:CCHC-type domain-containing protein n=1 Tax=Ceutorhynchus assimilis TaxID=467358 RepID=A0A9N9MN19_9CUCU|nr:unnamed protein product [Ceutorhynchus assimilis]